jgi:hypothetical protein
MMQIRSIGPPPEKHADRVVAEMLRHLAENHANLWVAVRAAIVASSDGSPKAQRKMEERIRRAGALETHLTPGKRGQYRLLIFDRLGWDPRRDGFILPDDPVPQQPWIACNLTRVESEGRGRDIVSYESRPALFITHHAMSRVAQRFGARTIAHLMAAAELIWEGALDLLLAKQGFAAWLDAREQGWRAPIEGNGVVVLKRHHSRKALVAATVFEDRQEERGGSQSRGDSPPIAAAVGGEDSQSQF